MRKELQDPQLRRQEIEKAIKTARDAYRRRPVEEAREAVLRLQDRFDEEGVDRLELLYAADSSLPGDGFWLDEIARILMRKPSLSPSEISFLMRKAMIVPDQLELWYRVFREAKSVDDPSVHAHAREECALALLPYFPEPDASKWKDRLLADEARNLFQRCLEESLERVMDPARDDADGRNLLFAAVEYFPDRADVLTRLADDIVKQEEVEPRSLAVVLRAMMHSGGKVRYGVWAAKGLMKIPGHHAEGIEMLRQMVRDNPRDQVVLEEYIGALKGGEAIGADDIVLLNQWVKKNPGDVRALELLADHHAATEDLGEEALRLYKQAASKSMKRRTYLRLIGKEAASRNDWSEVMDIFNEILASGQETEEVVLPLATACAEFQRGDEEAISIYRKAIALGSRKTEVHGLYCRYLYLTARNEPTSVTQFMQSASVCPECSWAQLGLVCHYLQTGDADRALDGALLVLDKHPGEMEAVKLAAQALAADYSRKQLAKLAKLEAGALRQLFEEAYRQAPEAGLIAMGLARRRLADGVRDEETVRLLGEVCRKHPDAVDLRLARADMLWDLQKYDSAVEMYRDLVERLNAGASPQLTRIITSQVRSRMLARVGQRLLLPPGPKAEDYELILEAAGEPDASAELILGAARLMADALVDHPRKLPLLQKALSYAPSDLNIEKAVAACHAAEGNPRPVVSLSIRLIKEGLTDEETVGLLRSIQGAVAKDSVPLSLVDELHAALKPKEHPPQLLLAGAELIFNVRPSGEQDLPLLEKLAEAFPRNVRVRRRLAQCFNAAGQNKSAAQLYDSLYDEMPEDNALVLEMAKANAKMGRNTRDCHKVAQRAVALEPKNADLRLHLAAIELAMGQYQKAAKNLDMLLESDPSLHSRVLTLLEHSHAVKTERGELNLILARTHIKAGRIDKALMILARLQSNYQKHFSDLMHCYDEIIAIEKENPRPYIERSILERISGQIDEAIADLDRAHRLVPDNLDIVAEYVDLLQQKIQGMDTPDPAMALQCGQFLQLLGDDHAAFEMAEIALELQPENQAALVLVARLQLRAGALQSCWRTLGKLKERKEALELYQSLSRAFAENEDHLHAAGVLTDAIEIAGPQRELLEQLRTLHQDQAKSAEGAVARQRILGTLSSKAQGRYELREELGSGAMGVVYKAYDRELDEIVVLKILPENFAQDQEALARFRNEAKAARKLAHPNIVRIHDIGEEGGRKHISMEYVGGGDLMHYLKKAGGKLPLRESIRVVHEICNALSHAHEEGVLHRDIKTANILLTPAGKVKLSDFGIASLFEAGRLGSDGTHGGGTIVGTPLYMSPEQFDAVPLTPASDLYSVGVLLYEVVSGAPPFTKGSLSYHHQFTAPVKIGGLPEKLWRIISTLLEKEPYHRFQTAKEVMMALEEVVSSEKPSGPGDTQRI